MTDIEVECPCRCHRGIQGKEFTTRFGSCSVCMDIHTLVQKLTAIRTQTVQECVDVSNSALLRLGLVASELARRMSDQEAANLIKAIIDKHDKLFQALLPSSETKEKA